MAVSDGISTDGQVGGARLSLPLFAVTLFLSAFLLFSVQPFFTKMILPRLGGSPAVWSVAMVFFQAMLLAGYLYAHLAIRFLGLKASAGLHMAVCALAFVALPIAIPAGWDVPPETGQSVWLLGLFGVAVGLPFFAVAANGPLLQAWFSRTDHPHAADPYFLYGASNVGSFASLILYIVLIEPLFAVQTQSAIWTGGFALLSALILACAAIAVARRRTDQATAGPIALAAMGSRRIAVWTLLGLIPSGLLVATTAHMSLDIAAAPFLWVAPLTLFLLTFVIVFRRRPLVSTRTLNLATAAFGVAAIASIYGRLGLPIWAEAGIHLGFFFAAALNCHAVLYGLRPPAGQLTSFYLWMSFGGVLGGIFASLAAPVMFDWTGEYVILIVVAMAVGSLDLRNGSALGWIAAAFAASVALVYPLGAFGGGNAEALLGLLAVTLMGAAAALKIVGSRLAAPVLVAILPAAFAHAEAGNDLLRERSFFGIVRVLAAEDGRFNLMMHGSTLHGAMENTDEGSRPEPLTYYHSSGGMAAALEAMRERRGGSLDHVGIVGMGTGSLACHRLAGEEWTFFEIDRAVVDAALDPALFRFMPDCAPDSRVVVGDARLTLADERNGDYDMLVIDAFSSDSIPAHLMTREAVRLYREKLGAGGLLVFHISNRYLELESVLAAVAAEEGLAMRAGIFGSSAPTAETRFISASHVVVMAGEEADLQPFGDDPRWRAPVGLDAAAWTDDYSNIFTALLRKQ